MRTREGVREKKRERLRRERAGQRTREMDERESCRGQDDRRGVDEGVEEWL